MKPNELCKASELLKDRRWRLEHLYHIINEKGADTALKLRWAQADFVKQFWYFNVILKARQEGFTTLIDIMGLDMALFNPNFVVKIIAETREKASEIMENKIKYPYEHLPMEVKKFNPIVNDGAGYLTFKNGSTVRVTTSSRSGTCNFLHISEYGRICAQYPKQAREIWTGSIPSVHAGSFAFVESTAMGREGKFYDLCTTSENLKRTGRGLSKDEWKFHFYGWHEHKEYRDTNPEIVIPERLAEYFDMLYLQHGITLDEDQQRWYVKAEKDFGEDMWAEYPSYPQEAFKVAQDGAYYKRQFERIYAENRITRVPAEETLPVFTFWDLGVSDDTSIWFCQFVGKEIRVIDYYEANGEGLPHYIKHLQDKPYRYGGHFAPHDIEQREFSTGISRTEYARKLGLEFERVLTNRDVPGGIEACRDLLRFCYFDEGKCERGLKCLEGYRKAWDDTHGCYRNKPLHDWTSHGADSFRTMAVAYKDGLIQLNRFDPVYSEPIINHGAF